MAVRRIEMVLPSPTWMPPPLAFRSSVLPPPTSNGCVLDRLAVLPLTELSVIVRWMPSSVKMPPPSA